MISGKLRKEYDRIENANRIYNDKLNNYRKLRYISLPLSFLFYFLLLITFIDNPLSNTLNILFGNYKQIVDLIFILMFSLFFGGGVYIKRLEKNIEKNLSLSNDEKIFYYVYNILNEINRYVIESNEKRKYTIMSNLLNELKTIITLINNWNCGNMVYIKKKYGQKVVSFKEKMNKIEYNEIKIGDENILNNLKTFLNALNEYLCDPYESGIGNLDLLLSNLPLKTRRVMVSYGITDHLYNQPIFFSILFSILIATLFLVIANNYNLGIEAMIVILLTSFGVSFNVLHTILGKEKKDGVIEKKRLSKNKIKL